MFDHAVHAIAFAFPGHSLTSGYLTIARLFDNPLIVDVMNAAA